jgi:hypothetical protein
LYIPPKALPCLHYRLSIPEPLLRVAFSGTLKNNEKITAAFISLKPLSQADSGSSKLFLKLTKIILLLIKTV